MSQSSRCLFGRVSLRDEKILGIAKNRYVAMELGSRLGLRPFFSGVERRDFTFKEEAPPLALAGREMSGDGGAWGCWA